MEGEDFSTEISVMTHEDSSRSSCSDTSDIVEVSLPEGQSVGHPLYVDSRTGGVEELFSGTLVDDNAPNKVDGQGAVNMDSRDVACDSGERSVYSIPSSDFYLNQNAQSLIDPHELYESRDEVAQLTSEVQGSRSHVGHPGRGQVSSGSDNGADLVFQKPSQGGQSRPGVILLGRGNSFSLGRSEVILLHGSRPARNRRKLSGERRSTSPHLGTHHHLQNGDLDPNSQQSTELLPSSPPPLSNGDASVLPLRDASLVEELEVLWTKAESIMAAKRGAVQRVLEDFGIGEAGGEAGGDDADCREEEEEIWQAVQDRANLSDNGEGSLDFR